MRKIWDNRFAGKLEGWGILRNGGILVIGGMILKWGGGGGDTPIRTMYMKFFNPFTYLFNHILISKLTHTESCARMLSTLRCYLNVGTTKYMDCFLRTVRFCNQPWFCRLQKITKFLPYLRNISHQCFKLETEPAAEKSIAYPTVLAWVV